MLVLLKTIQLRMDAIKPLIGTTLPSVVNLIDAYHLFWTAVGYYDF